MEHMPVRHTTSALPPRIEALHLRIEGSENLTEEEGSENLTEDEKDALMGFSSELGAPNYST